MCASLADLQISLEQPFVQMFWLQTVGSMTIMRVLKCFHALQGQTTSSVPTYALNKTVIKNYVNNNNAPSVQTRWLESPKMMASLCLALFVFGSLVSYAGCSGQVTVIPT